MNTSAAFGVASQTRFARANKPRSAGELEDIHIWVPKGPKAAGFVYWVLNQGKTSWDHIGAVERFLTIMCFRIPNFLDALKGAGHKFVIHELPAVALTPVMTDLKTAAGGTDAGAKTAAYDALKALLPKNPRDGTGAPIGDLVYPAWVDAEGFFPYPVSSITSLVDIYLAVACHALFKAPSADNQDAFRTARPLAMIRMLGWAEDLVVEIGPEVGDLHRLSVLQSAMTLRPHLRRCVVSETIKWTVSATPSSTTAMVSSLVRMSEEQGMTIYFVVKRMLHQYEWLATYPLLRGELYQWNRHAEQLEGKLPPALRPYYRSIDGQQANLFQRRHYPMLFELAKRGSQLMSGGKGVEIAETDLDVFVNPILTRMGLLGATVATRGHGGEDSSKAAVTAGQAAAAEYRALPDEDEASVDEFTRV